MHRALGALLVAAGVAFSWWEGGLGQSSAAGHLGVLGAIAWALGSATLAGVGRQAVPSGQWLRGPFSLQRHLAERPQATVGVVIWIVLVLAVIGWDLNSFVHQSHDLPTLSSLVGHVTAHRAGRTAVVALWLTLGAALALGGRRTR